MTSRHVTKWNSRFPTIAAAAVLAWCTVFATEASAACFAADGKGPSNAPTAQPGGHARPIAFGDADSQEPVVGMWHSVFRLGADPNGLVYDETFQQFGSDGMENIISNGLPPILGNVCIGVWKQVGLRTYRLRHMTWNWGPETNDYFPVPGKFAGQFVMLVTLTVSRDGKSYRGTWAAKNFDTFGNPLPAFDADGVVRATRITVD
jgi:hypothetical protein